jgi:hypothetical protein
LVTRDPNSKHGVGEGFLDNADEFDHILLRHRTQEKTRTRAEASYRAISALSRNWLQFS